MSSFEWNSSLSVGNEKIDSQHKELIRLHNNLHESLLNDTLEDTAKAKTTTLDALMDYFSYHFSTEEGIFDEINFPKKKKHCQQHAEFTKKIENLREDIRAERIVLTTSLVKLLRNWIVEHIAVEDLQYAQYLKKTSQEPDSE